MAKKKRVKKSKKILLKKKAKKLKKARKKPRKVLFEVKPLERTKQAKLKKPSKPAKPLVKTTTHPPPSRKRAPTKLIKTTKPKKPKLVKPIEPPIFKTKIKIIGIGGGGSSIVSEIAQKIKKASFVVANIDQQVLKGTTGKIKHFQFGQKLTQGLGTGMNPELGEMAAENEKERIKELLRGIDFCILVSCLGGGTGSGASPIFAKISRNLRNLTLGIFILPFKFEGEKKAQIAKDSLEKLKPNLNGLVIIPNESIFQVIDKDTPLKEALSVINKNLTESLEGLIEMIYQSGLINIDFADLKNLLKEREKLVYLNTAEVKKSDQPEEVAKKVLSSPLYPYPTQRAKGILFNIAGGENLSLDEIEQIGSTISNSVDPQAKVIFGITQNKKYKDKIKITLLVTGCREEKKSELKEEPLKKPKSLKTSKLKRKISAKEKPKKPKILKIKAPKIPKEPLQAPTPPPESTEVELLSPLSPYVKKIELREKVEVKVRRNALDLRKAVKEEEKKMLAQERKWETPAFLRYKPTEKEEKTSR